MTTEVIEKKSNGWLGGENQNMGGAQRETRWLTPPSLIAPLGPFDLDPCGAPGQELATRIYLLESGDDGLRDPWEGRVWLNPPYGKQADPFMEKMAAHNRGIALVFARTETRTWHNHIWPNASAILFLAGRVTSLDAEGVAAKANSGAPSVLIAYGATDANILERSGIAGKFVRLSC